MGVALRVIVGVGVGETLISLITLTILSFKIPANAAPLYSTLTGSLLYITGLYNICPK